MGVGLGGRRQLALMSSYCPALRHGLETLLTPRKLLTVARSTGSVGPPLPSPLWQPASTRITDPPTLLPTNGTIFAAHTNGTTHPRGQPKLTRFFFPPAGLSAKILQKRGGT